MRNDGRATERLAVAIVLIIFGGLGTFSNGTAAVPAWRAAHGQGATGNFTLTAPMSCDRYKPPRQRCGWFGDFVSDDGAVVHRHRELSGGLPQGSQAGDVITATDGGGKGPVYKLGDADEWELPAALSGVSVCILALGAVLLWSFLRRNEPFRVTGRGR